MHEHRNERVLHKDWTMERRIGWKKSLLTAVALIGLAACGGNGGAHSNPSAPASTGHSTAMTGLDARAGSGAAQVGSTGFFLTGSAPQDYTAEGDPTTASGVVLSSPSAASDAFGTVMTEQAPGAFAGKRVRLTATVRTSKVSGWAGLWLRVDGQTPSETLAFDNMSRRPISGDSDAATYSVVLDVSSDTANIAYGTLLVGQGSVTVSDLVLETVDASVPSTDMLIAPGWFLAGSAPAQYTASGSPLSDNGMVLASSTAPSGKFGTAMTEIDPSAHLGKRVRLSALVSSQDVAGWAGLWMRIDAANGGTVGFDNMQERPITGTTAEAQVSVVLDVPESASDLAFGALLDGPGQLTVRDLKLEDVDTSVPTTGSGS